MKGEMLETKDEGREDNCDDKGRKKKRRKEHYKSKGMK